MHLLEFLQYILRQEMNQQSSFRIIRDLCWLRPTARVSQDECSNVFEAPIICVEHLERCVIELWTTV